MKKPLSWIELSKENLLHNISVFRSLLKDKGLAVVVKANAYGHGMQEIVSLLADHVDYLQVDDIEELRALRMVTTKPALVLGYVQKDDLEELLDLNGIVTVFDLERIAQIDEIGKRKKQNITVHVEIDALLGRLGLLADQVDHFMAEIKQYKHVTVGAFYAHFSDIEDSENIHHACAQHAIIKSIAEKYIIPFHIAATAGILSEPSGVWGSCIVRLGIGMYGLWPSARLKKEWEHKMQLLPVLSWKTKVAQIKTLPTNYPIGYGCSYVTTKETVIAVIPQGYSDGYDRALSNNSAVLVRGMRCCVLGRIAMNMFVVDVSEVPDVCVEQEVVLLGKQGKEEITAEELAENIGTINYEVVARISPLLKRVLV